MILKTSFSSSLYIAKIRKSTESTRCHIRINLIKILKVRPQRFNWDPSLKCIHCKIL